MRFNRQLILGALSALSVSAMQPIAVDVSIVEGTDRTREIGTYRFASFLENGDFIRAYFPEELEYTGAVHGNVEVCEIDFGEGPVHIDECTYNPGSNSIEFPIPSEERPFGLVFFELGGMLNPPTS